MQQITFRAIRSGKLTVDARVTQKKIEKVQKHNPN